MNITKEGGQRKTLKSILKIKGVRDPAKPPPKTKQTIKVLTAKGHSKRQKTIKRRVAKMSDKLIKQVVEANGLLKTKNTPVHIMREMVEGGMISGFI